MPSLPGRSRLPLCALAFVVVAGCAVDEPTAAPGAPVVTSAPTPTPTPTSAPTLKVTPTRAPTPSKSPTSKPDTRKKLAALVVKPRPSGTLGYDRDAFGSSWSDIDGNGCNQRDDVLLRDARPGSVRTQQQGRCDHDVLSGTWVDPYAGRTIVLTDMKNLSQAQAVQIDHVVPLAEAWVSGARTWTDERRRAYANTLTGLLAVDGPTNASKSDDDPAAWRPRKGYQCRYAVRSINVKYAWNLDVDPSEVRALNEMLGYC
ncbi:hypothetical protein ABIE44_002772 [Marmoricola sp. OAE513]|uniref:HNH endonuclease family protein n=1 Tax=Marmoricola sp. OAE513 TaxID=2817894 RepID=UPI001AE2C9A3